MCHRESEVHCDSFVDDKSQCHIFSERYLTHVLMFIGWFCMDAGKSGLSIIIFYIVQICNSRSDTALFWISPTICRDTLLTPCYMPVHHRCHFHSIAFLQNHFFTSSLICRFNLFSGHMLFVLWTLCKSVIPVLT